MTHFAQGHTTAPTYGIELDLEHQRSYVRALLDAYAEGNPHIDYAMRARADLVELTRLRDTLAHSGASTDAQTAILAYVALMDTAVREFIVQVETVPVPHARPIAP